MPNDGKLKTKLTTSYEEAGSWNDEAIWYDTDRLLEYIRTLIIDFKNHSEKKKIQITIREERDSE